MSSNVLSETIASAPSLASGVFTDTASHDVAVSVRGLAKSYTIAKNAVQHSTMGEALIHKLKNPLAKPEKDTFWALNDVNFDIQKGDVVGIIGRNGAGKSTLLKILSRITEPTRGRIDLYGRVGSLLEVGTGFHPELTGRENVFLNGAILGMKKSEIARQFDAIVDFSGTAQFLDTPVKRYSSGMYVRLAFAVAAHLNPEILIIDEVLAVGDAEFQKKCMGKMRDVADSGRTILFVSHNMAAITNLCTKAVLLKSGSLEFYGKTAEAEKIYLHSRTAAGVEAKKNLQDYRPAWAKPYITGCRVLNSSGEEQDTFPLGADVTFEVTFTTPPGVELNKPELGVVINHAMLGTAGGVNTRMTGFEVNNGPYTSGIMHCRIKRLPFLHGNYTADLWLGDGLVDVDALLGSVSFTLEPSDIYGTGQIPFGDMGLAFIEPQWRIAKF